MGRENPDPDPFLHTLYTSHLRDHAGPGDGYFRREWKIAAERTHDMASGVPFLLPVVIDDTGQNSALVPDEFQRVQWTRLPRGVPTPQFVEQVKRLLEGNPVAGVADPGSARHRPGSATPATKKSLPAWIWGAAAAVIMAGAAGVMLSRKPEAPAAPAPAPAAAPAPTQPVVPLVADKSVAVLPFTNMSEDKDASSFFSDGIHEDILTNLALIRELRVVSRTSVMKYRDTKKSMKEIAQELGVTYILEGSVRRSGNKVRVTGQLIHAATDEHVWAQKYDRDLTDIFTIQSELSSQIANALKAALSPEERALIARKPTENPAAYDLILRSRDVINREGNSQGPRSKQIALLEKAVELDPNFAQAWGELAAACAYWSFSSYEGMDARLAQAKTAIERAMQLAPDDPEVFSSLGTYYYYGFRDYIRATEQYEKRAKLQPNSPIVFNSLALIQRRQGHWAQSLVNARRACELDPANIGYQRNLLATLLAGRHWDEAFATQRRITALLPDSLDEAYTLAVLRFQATGSTQEGEAFFARLTPGQRNSPLGVNLRGNWAATIGDNAEAIRLDKLQPYYDEDGTPHWQQAFFGAFTLFSVGDKEAAKTRLGDYPAELHARLVREPKNVFYWTFLSGMEAILGHKEEALRCADRSVEIMSESLDALDGVNYAKIRAKVYDWTGDKERALAEYTRLIRVPSPYFMNVHEMKHAYSTLHGDPRFEALLNDPANNAPLF